MFTKKLITVPVLTLTVLPPLVDFSESHVQHPDLTRHARFHTAWLVLENSLVGLQRKTLTILGTNRKEP